MKRLSILIFSLLIASCASQNTTLYSHLSDDELETSLLNAEAKHPVQYCERMLPIAQEIFHRDNSDIEKRAIKNYAKFQCAISEQHWDIAYSAMIEFEKDAGISTGILGFNLAFFSDHRKDAVARLEAMARKTGSNEILSMDPRLFWGFFNTLSANEDKELRARAVNAMTESPYFDYFDMNFRSALAGRKLRFSAESGHFPDSERWIAEIIRPTYYLPMLADRKFEALWPDLERAVGDNFVDINDRYVNAVMDEYRRNPSNMEAYSDVAHALVYAGHFNEAIGFVRVPEDDEFSAITEHESWAINMKIGALDALGREDEGTVLFEKLATIPVYDGNKYWLINFTINRAARLKSYERWEDALEAANYAEGFSGSPYAEMLIRRIKICALTNLRQDTTHLLDELYENRKDSYVVAAMAMMCSGDEELAAKTLLEGLEDESEREYVLAVLQDPQMSFHVVRDKSPGLHHLLGTNEELLTAFEREARLIPDKYIPLARLKESQN